MNVKYNQVADLLNRAQKMGLSVYEQEEELMIKAVKHAKIDPAILKEIKAHKEELIFFLKDEIGAKEQAERVEEVIPVVSRGADQRIPLTFSQEGLWLVDQFYGSLQYHVSRVLRLRGKLNRTTLASALNTLVERHETLRTVIKVEEGGPYQQILSPQEWQMKYDDNERFADTDFLHNHISEELRKPFDLANDYMLRAHLLKCSEEDHLLILILHHIASDGWSMSIMISDLILFYQAQQLGKAADIQPFSIQYADYAAWQRKRLSGEVLTAKLNWWKEQLADATPLKLPTDFPRPAFQSTAGNSRAIKIEKGLAEALRAYSLKEGATLFMSMLGIYKVLLYRYSGEADICVGTPIANRSRKELEPLVGLFINSIVLRSQLDGQQSFSDFLQHLKTTTLSAYANQEIPFEQIVKEVELERDTSRNPIFQAVFVLQNMPEAPALELGELDIVIAPFGEQSSKFDLTFTITEMKEGLHLNVEYCSDLYTDATIERMIAHYLNLLSSVLAAPNTCIDELKLLSTEEEQEILQQFNAAASDYPEDKTIVELFEAEAARRPTASALRYESTQLSYEELNRQANQLAHHLRKEYQIGSGDIVGLLMDRSANLLISILGILKSGAAYLPLQVKSPWERNRALLKDAGLRLLLTEADYMFELEGYEGKLFVPEIQLAELPAESENPKLINQVNDLAYVMYTSGTTGLPKGTLISHQNVVSLVKGIDYVALNENDRLLSTGTPSFDAATFEYWGMLLNGGELILCTESKLLDPIQLKQLIEEKGCTKMWFTSSWFNELVENDCTLFDSLQAILVGGEKLSAAHIRKLRERNSSLQIINGYGPTENTSFSLTYSIGKEVTDNIPIGKALNNRTAYVLDRAMKLCPVGVIGELWVGGAGVGLGYLNDETLTNERFRPDPFANKGRLYRTGDLARWLPEGRIEFLGRADRQVKIRGYRLELGEIEQQLMQLDEVSNCTLIAWDDERGMKRLVAYVVTEGELDKEKLQTQLSQHLPNYMVPSLWISLETLPLTANGKLDRKALPSPDESALLRKIYVAPETPTEEKLVAIWQELLNVEKVGTSDNFFELGGHSLLATRLVSAIQDTFSITISIVKVFQLYSITPLAGYLDVLLAQQEDIDLEDTEQEEFDLDDL